MSLLAGVKVISKFILNKGVKDAVKKFGKEAVDKVMKSKTHKEMIKNPPMTSGQKAVVGASAGTAAVGTAATGYGYKTTSDKMKEVKADLNKDGQISGYEKKRSMAIQKSMASNQPLRKSTDKKFMGMTSYKENK